MEKEFLSFQYSGSTTVDRKSEFFQFHFYPKSLNQPWHYFTCFSTTTPLSSHLIILSSSKPELFSSTSSIYIHAVSDFLASPLCNTVVSKMLCQYGQSHHDEIGDQPRVWFWSTHQSWAWREIVSHIVARMWNLTNKSSSRKQYHKIVPNPPVSMLSSTFLRTEWLPCTKSYNHTDMAASGIASMLTNLHIFLPFYSAFLNSQPSLYIHPFHSINTFAHRIQFLCYSPFLDICLTGFSTIRVPSKYISTT